MDTRTLRVQEIVPARAGLLTISSCGPTVSRPVHVGDLRNFLVSDVLRRTAELHGLRVRWVMNIADVDPLQEADAVGEDPLPVEAAVAGRDPFAAARRNERTFHADLGLLNIKPADASPRTSEGIDLILTLITVLLDKGHAFIGTDGSVSFDARSYPSTSGNLPAEAESTGTRRPANWALWEPATAGRELTWDSPWGRGFPGRHVGCSAVSLDLLGGAIDVHTGGLDPRFPPHEHERAQSNCAAGREVVQQWVHGEQLLFEGRPMAPAHGNVVLVSDVAARCDPLALRLALLSTRYREQTDLSWDLITGADRTLQRWRWAVAGWAESPSAPIDPATRSAVLDACDDDLDTPRALEVLRAFENSEASDGSKFETFAWADRLLGLDLARLVGQSPAAGPTVR